VIAAVTHPLFTKEWVERSKIDRFFVTNTIPLPEEIPSSRVEIVSASGLFGKAIECIIHDESISSLFRPRS
jgi:ribose-phosphate pyrophosphokinase